MAFTKTSGTKLIECLPPYCAIQAGYTTMSSGTGTATAPNLSQIQGIIGCVQGATGVGEMVICTATSGNTATLETVGEGGSATGSSVVMWLAWGTPKL